MWRIAGWLIAGLAALSFILLLATMTLWGQGYYGQLGYASQSDTNYWVFQNVRGGFQYVHVYTDSGRSLQLHTQPGWYAGPAYAPVVSPLIIGFGIARMDQKDWHVKAVVIPAWALVIVFSIIPCLRIWGFTANHQRRKRELAGRCQKCGYDLRASSERCPECRAAIQRKTLG